MKIIRHPFFIIGLAVRFLFIMTLKANSVVEWYSPFMENSLSLNLDPWAMWLDAGGTPLAFPYGFTMWFSLLPLTFLSKLLGISVYYGYMMTLLVSDILLLSVLTRIFPDRDGLLLRLYWLSPIVIIASYVMGYNDLIPVLFLTFSFYAIREHLCGLSGFFVAVAISSKLSMLVSLPFFLVYFYHNRPLRRFICKFIYGFFIAALFFVIPFILSQKALVMLFSNPEISKIYEMRLNLGDAASIYLVPFLYCFVLYSAWRVKRINYELFYVLSGMSFLVVVLMTPSSPGWFLWLVPWLVGYQLNSDRLAISLVATLSLLYVLDTMFWYIPPGATESLLRIGEKSEFSHMISMNRTMMLVVGLVLSMRLWREAIIRNDFFRLSRKPFVIGIAGDSGSGKDTLANAIEGLFGVTSVTKISGDDYHHWDRQKPMWQLMTHLNPIANDLAGFARDILELVDGKAIQSVHYDHTTGRMGRPSRVQSNDVIIASGLHALYLPKLRATYDLSIYLDIDESLRKYFKIIRDVTIRGHSIETVEHSFMRRESDAVKFVRPQEEFADIVMSLKPIHPRLLEGTNVAKILRYKITTRARHGLNEQDLVRVLVGVCGFHVDMVYSDNPSMFTMTVEGESCADDVAFAAKLVCPNITEFLDIEPKWQDGITGLMQLITVSHINQALIKRLV